MRGTDECDVGNNLRHIAFIEGRYIAGVGRHGLIDGHAIALNSNLANWLEGTIMLACPSASL